MLSVDSQQSWSTTLASCNKCIDIYMYIILKTWQLRMHCNLRPPEPRQPFSAFYDATTSLKSLNLSIALS